VKFLFKNLKENQSKNFEKNLLKKKFPKILLNQRAGNRTKFRDPSSLRNSSLDRWNLDHGRLLRGKNSTTTAIFAIVTMNLENSSLRQFKDWEKETL